MPTRIGSDVSAPTELALWRASRCATVSTHAINEGGAGARLLTHIALTATPDDPWVEIPTHLAAAVFASGDRGGGSKLLKRLCEKGLLQEGERQASDAPRRFRLTLSCNALCADDDHVFDTAAEHVQNWLGLDGQALSDRLDGMEPSEAEAYRRLLIDSCRIGTAPAPTPVPDGRTALALMRQGLIHEASSSQHLRFIPAGRGPR